MTDAALSFPNVNATAADAPAAARKSRPVVPSDSIAGRALVAVIAIMTFLASLTTSAVVMVDAMAGDWQAAVAQEMTIQVRPSPGRDLEAEVAAAARIARETPGIAEVIPYSREASASLLEPWLGTGLALDDLPVPRLIVIRVSADGAPDLALLRRRLTEEVVGASLDDHRGWIERMRTMTRTAVAIGLGVLLLVLAATVLLVAFATRGAMATNRGIVEALHFVGARDRFIAREFQRNFLMLGLKGGVLGGGMALLLFALVQLFSHWFGSAPEADPTMLFGMLTIGRTGYAAVIGQVILIAAVTAVTSRLIVYRTLRTID
jgi:cell division transport system permease protein